MNRNPNTIEILAWVTLSALIIIAAGFLAYYVTAWALLALVCIPNYSSGESVTVEQDGTTVTVTRQELSESDIERAVQRVHEDDK